MSQGPKDHVGHHFSIQKWDKWQSFRGGRGGWLKLSIDFFDDPKIHSMPDSQRLAFISIMILAAKLGNRVPWDPRYVRRRSGSRIDPDLALFMAQGLIACECTTSCPEKVRGEEKEEKEEDVRAVHDHWVSVMGKRATETIRPERRTKILARLREGFSVEQLKHAIDGCKASPFHSGKNDKGTVYNDIGLICRNGSKVEAFLDLYAQHVLPPEEPGIKHGLPTKGPWEKAV